MARKDGEFLRGVLGDLVYRVVRGKQIVSKRCVPGTMKHTKSSIRSAVTFGVAASLSGQIIDVFYEVLKGFNDYGVNNRINSIIVKSLNNSLNSETMQYFFDPDSFSGLEDLNFNLDSKTENFLVKLPVVNLDGGKLSVVIPAMTIPKQFKFPPQTFKCELKISLALFRLKDGFRSRKLDSQSVVLFKNAKVFDGCKFEFDVPSGCLCLVSLSIEYFLANGEHWHSINNKMFNPVSICGVMLTPGEYEKEIGRVWTEIIKFN